MKLWLKVSVCLFFVAGTASAQNPKKSTPEERAAWAASLHKFEAHPLDDQALNEAAQAMNRIQAVDDVVIAPCGLFAEFPQKWNKATPILFYLLALSAYQTETGKSDSMGENLYATRSVLKAYANAVEQNPKLRDKRFDAVAKVDADGKLEDLARKVGCR